MDDHFMPIDVDSNGEEEVVEIDSRHAMKTTSVHTSECKLCSISSHASSTQFG